MPNTIKTISLTDDDKSYLNKLLTQSTLEIRVYQRARILLLKSEGASNEAIADKLDIGICVESKKELEDRIYRYFDEINKEPVPYKWTYKMDTIDLSQQDIDSIVYEVINAKTASAENKNKQAPTPIS